MAQQLTGKQVRFLRGQGHHLNPVVMIGKEGISSNLIDSTEEALDQHELIKIKLQESCLLERKEVAEDLASQTGAAVVQVLGRTILLFRRSDKELIALPKGK